MKRIALVLTVACVMSAVAPLYAETTKEQKDQCLLASKECANEVDSISKKIQKLRREIKKGNRVYSDGEIRKLQTKLKEAEELVDTMLTGGN